MSVVCVLVLIAGCCFAPLSWAYAAESSRIGGSTADAGGSAGQASGLEDEAASGSGEDTASVAPVSSMRIGAGELERDSFNYGADVQPGETFYPPYWTSANGISSYCYGDTVVSVPDVLTVGVDVSEHQGWIDWEQVKNAGVDFAIIRCGYGGTEYCEDGQWLSNVRGAQAAGVPFGVYLYSYATSPAEAEQEAVRVLQALSEAGLGPSDLSLPVFYDLEESSLASTANQELLGVIATAFCGRIQAAGYEVGIYSSVSWWQDYLTDDAFSNDTWHRWVAGYYNGSDGVAASVPNADMWQFCSRGTVPGISGNVDMSFRYVDTVEGGGALAGFASSVGAVSTKALMSIDVLGGKSAGYLVLSWVGESARDVTVTLSYWDLARAAVSVREYCATPVGGAVACFVPTGDVDGLVGPFSVKVVAQGEDGKVVATRRAVDAVCRRYARMP